MTTMTKAMIDNDTLNRPTDVDRAVAEELCGVLMEAVRMARPRVLPEWQVRAWKATYQRAVELHEQSAPVLCQREQLAAALDSLAAIRRLVESGQPFICAADLLAALDGEDR